MKLPAIIVFLLASVPCHAQLPDYHVQLFDESFGIETNDVRKVITDHDGFIWILHNDRVQRFDGKRIENFILEESLNSIVCDRNNEIWVSNFSRLYHFARDNNRFSLISIDTIKDLGIASIFQVPNDNLWVLTSKGFYVLQDSAYHFKAHPDTLLGHLSRVQTRGMDMGTNSLFFSSSDSLFVDDLATHSRKGMRLPVANIRTVTCVTDQIALVSVWKGIVYLYDFSKMKMWPIDFRHHLKNVTDYFMTVFNAERISKDEYLLVTLKGLLHFNLRTGQFRQLALFEKGKPLEGNADFYDLYIDPAGTAWIAYNDYGIVSFRIKGDEIGLVRNFESDYLKAWDNNVRNFAEDEHGNLWLATFNGFVCWHMDEGYFEPFFATEGSESKLNHPSIRGIVYDGTNLILGQTNRGIWIYNPVSKKYRRPSYLPGKSGEATRRKLEASFTEQIYTLEDGRHFISGSNAGYLISGKNYLVTEIDYPGGKEKINFCYQDGKKNIWIGSYRNLYCLDSAFQYKFKVPQKQSNGFIRSLYEWNQDTLLAGGNGLFILTVRDTTPALTSLPVFDGMQIHTIYKDELNKLWLATSNGLFRYDLITNEIQNFSNFESIKGNAFYLNSYHYSDRGLLFLGSSRGIIYVDPTNIGNTNDSLHLVLASMMVNIDTIYSASTRPEKLKYFENNIAFDFVAPYFRNAEKLHYRYRLIGLHDEWISNANNSNVLFHSLPPGSYSFEAGVSLNGLDWFDLDAPVSFRIRPPFWKTWWFLALVFIAAGMSLYAIFRYRLTKKLEVEKLRTRIARDLHDDIGSVLSNIHIISSMAYKKEMPDLNIKSIFEKIRESSKTTLDNMQDIVWAINPENDTLEQVIARMKDFGGEICEPAGIEFQLVMGADLERIKISINKRKDLFLVFKEAVNNAVKYSHCTAIMIRLYKNKSGDLELEIADDGKGFDEVSVRNGNGLRNMRERAKDAEGKLQIYSRNGKGTSVRFLMPVT